MGKPFAHEVDKRVRENRVARTPYLLGGDERRDVRGDRRRVHLTMTTGELKKLAGSPSTTGGVPSAVRSARCSSSTRERNGLDRSRSDRPAASGEFAACRAHARVPVVRAELIV